MRSMLALEPRPRTGGATMVSKRKPNQNRRRSPVRIGTPGLDFCVRDDSTECYCPRCEGEQVDWERLQGWDE